MMELKLHPTFLSITLTPGWESSVINTTFGVVSTKRKNIHENVLNKNVNFAYKISGNTNECNKGQNWALKILYTLQALAKSTT